MFLGAGRQKPGGGQAIIYMSRLFPETAHGHMNFCLVEIGKVILVRLPSSIA